VYSRLNCLVPKFNREFTPINAKKKRPEMRKVTQMDSQPDFSTANDANQLEEKTGC
jgi:hypothetical protein